MHDQLHRAGNASRQLAGHVCVVAGATRGAGRGIACCLGEAGATVYCTGRSTRGHAAAPGRPETIDETAELVTARGGRGIAVQVDHSDAAQVEALFQRVRRDHGHLDVLVNDIWGGDALTEFGTPLLLERDRGLIVEVTDGDLPGYRANLFYDLAKSSVVRLAYGMSMELRGCGVTALAADPQVGAKAGGVYGSWTLARECGFCDVDGRQPDFASYIDGITDEIAARGPATADERMLAVASWFRSNCSTPKTHWCPRPASAPRWWADGPRRKLARARPGNSRRAPAVRCGCASSLLTWKGRRPAPPDMNE